MKTNYLIIVLIFIIPLILTISTLGNIFLSPITYAIWLTMEIGLISTLTFYSNYRKSKEIKSNLVNVLRNYKVASIVVSYNEDPETLKYTIISIKDATGALGDVFLLDDSTHKEKVELNKKFCEENNIKYLHRDNRRGYKAGALNDFLKLYGNNYDLIAVFDSDQRPVKSFFYDLIPFFNDPKIAFVQIPQAYTESNTRVAIGAAYQQMPFNEVVMTGRDVTGSAFILGSGFIARISALMDVGYFDESAVTEDLATSIELHSKGYKSIYVNYPGIWYGEPPKTVDAYIIQQGRWSLGTLQLFKKIIKANMDWRSFLDYFSGILYWFKEGPLTIFEIAAPVLFLIFKFFILKVNPWIFSIAYYPVFIFSLLMFVYSMKKREYGPKGFFYHQFIELLMMPPVTLSFFAWIMRRRVPFKVTPKNGKNKTSKWVALYIFLEIVLIISIISGILWYKSTSLLMLKYSIIINLTWAIYFLFLNTGTFFLFFEKEKNF